MWCGVRTVIAAGAMALVLLTFGTGRLTPVDWVLGGAGGLAAFAGVLLGTRELTTGEIEAAIGKVRAALPGG